MFTQFELLIFKHCGHWYKLQMWIKIDLSAKKRYLPKSNFKQ